MAFRFNHLRTFTQDYALGKIISMVISLWQMALLTVRQPSKKLLRQFGHVFAIKPTYSMLSTTRLVNLYNLGQEIERLGIKGDIVECGVWNGGAAAMLARGLYDTGKQVDRTVWLFDSFEGLPPPGSRDNKSEVENYFPGLCKGAIQNVQDIFARLGLSMERVKIVKGWLSATLKGNDIGPIALLHVDTDWYDSVKTPLDYLYAKVVPGGFIVVDDYGFHHGCKAAVHDFLREQGLEGRIELKKVDRSAVYFQKPR